MKILSFGEKIRFLREQSNLTLRQAAAKLDIDQSVLSKYELGKRLPSVDFIKSFANHFDTDGRELLALLISEQILCETQDPEVIELSLQISRERLNSQRE